MLYKIHGIALKTTTYSESSVVLHAFTDKFGLQSYLINGVKKPKAKIRMNMLQPLHLLEMVAYHKATTGLQRVSEARPSPVLKSIPYDIIKSTMAIFINEVLYRSIKQQGTDEPLFNFIFNSVCWLDEAESANVNFHLSFLLKLTRYLGFAPDISGQQADIRYFDMQEGNFTASLPTHPHYIDNEYANWFSELYTTPFEALATIKIPGVSRRILLNKILMYFQLHTDSLGEIKSHHVLEEVLG